MSVVGAGVGVPYDMPTQFRNGHSLSLSWKLFSQHFLFYAAIWIALDALMRAGLFLLQPPTACHLIVRSFIAAAWCLERVSKIVPQSNPEASEIEEGTIGGE